MDKNLIYNILLVKYMEKHKIKDEILVFSDSFFYGDVDDKIEILVEAINNNIKVSETKKFNDCLEGVIDFNEGTNDFTKK